MGGYYRYSIFEHASHDSWTNPPQAIYDYWIYEKTINGKHRFVLLWACRQAREAGNNTPAIHGMAYCWTRQPNLSMDGYGDPYIPGNPDTRPYCFIGFNHTSPWLNQTITAGNNYKHWLIFFYYHALNGCSIKEALYKACVDVGISGGWMDQNNPLRAGFKVYWPFEGPEPRGEYPGWMRVIGNGNILLIG